MRSRFLALSLLLAATLAGPASAATARDDGRGEARLAKLLAGRTPGPSVDCIQLRQITSTEVVRGTAIVYRVGGTLYVNRPDSGASSLDRDDILVTSTPLSQLCSVDVVRLVDPVARFQTGFVNLGRFVPYSRRASE